MIDVDLAILLTKAREHSVALVGPAAEELFDPVPEQDLFEALNETLKLWNSQPDWAGDERNVVLTLSRIWYTEVTGKIVPKDVAADWAMERLPLPSISPSYLHCETRFIQAHVLFTGIHLLKRLSVGFLPCAGLRLGVLRQFQAVFGL